MLSRLLDTGISSFKIPESNLQICYTSDQYLGDIIKGPGVYFVESGLNSGKTVMLRRFLKAHPQLSSVTISSRITYAQSTWWELKQAGLQGEIASYQQRPIPEHQHFVVQTESLYRVTRTYSVVILDEITSIAMQFDSKLHNVVLKTNQAKFISLIQKADYVIVMDAHLDVRATGLVSLIRPGEVFHLTINRFPTYAGYQAIQLNEAQWLTGIEADLRAGLNLQIPVASLQYARKNILPLLDRLIPGKYLFYSSLGCPEIHNVNELWTQYRVVLYTSTVGPGVDFNREHFHRRYVYATVRSTTVEEILQMSGRVRHLRDKKVCIFFSPARMAPEPEEIEQIRAKWLTQLNTGDRFLGLQNLDPQIVRAEFMIMGFEDTIWSWLSMQNTKYRNLSRNRFLPRYWDRLKAAGFEIQPTAADLAPKALEVLKQIKMENSRVLAQADQLALIRAPIYSDPSEWAECQKQHKSGKATPLQRLGREKTLFWKLIREEAWAGIQAQPEILVSGIKLRSKFLQFRRLLDSDEQKLAEMVYSQRMHSTTPDLRLARLRSLQWITSQLGVESLMDRTTIISSLDLDLKLWSASYPQLASIWNLRGKIPKTKCHLVETINRLLEVILGCGLEKITRCRSGDQDQVFYQLRPRIRGLDPILAAMKLAPPKYGLTLPVETKSKDPSLLEVVEAMSRPPKRLQFQPLESLDTLMTSPPDPPKPPGLVSLFASTDMIINPFD